MSARSMMRGLAFGMSRPDYTIRVEATTPSFPSQKSTMLCSSSPQWVGRLRGKAYPQQSDVRQGLGRGLRRRVDLRQRRLGLGGGDRDADLPGQFLVDLETDQPGERLLGLLRRTHLDGARIQLDGLAEVSDLGVEGRDRDPLVARDRRGAKLDRAAPGHQEPGAEHEGGYLDKPA